MKRSTRAFLAALCVPALVAGCGLGEMLTGGKSVEYKSAGKLPPLEVPPDLTRPGRDDRYAVPDMSPGGTATFSAYNAERGGGPRSTEVLPAAAGVRIERDGNTRYIVVAEPPDKLWTPVKEFWQENGFLLKVEVPDAGVMETDWAENRAKIPQDPLRNLLGKVLDQAYSTGERDKFRTRLERTSSGGTEIFISHRGMVEQVVNSSRGMEGTVWEPRPADPELEAEFLRRLMVKLGVEDARAKSMLSPDGKRQDRARIVEGTDGASVLRVEEPFDRAWRRVGVALDRVGFTVEDRDRTKGIYFVRYADPQEGAKKDTGLLSKLAFWRSTDTAKPAEQYQVVVNAATDASQVRIYGKDGGPDKTGASKKILGLLYDQLK
ncbi:MAG TPA: outer membrane protein assembly factor BamC [Burkholderiales bacterium]|nr:outer membrane protein assembly factor BamC [Burkholderiales bacterium]